MSNATPLTPPDPKRCQAETITRNPWVMGGPLVKAERCPNVPTWIATEAVRGPDGRCGSMSLCSDCRAVMEKQLPAGSVVFTDVPPLPSWAIASSTELVLGSHLATRDGRKTGNAHVVNISPGPRGTVKLLYTVLTDAGNEMKLNAAEVRELFHDPQYVSDVTEVMRKFSPLPEPST